MNHFTFSKEIETKNLNMVLTKVASSPNDKNINKTKKYLREAIGRNPNFIVGEPNESCNDACLYASGISNAYYFYFIGGFTQNFLEQMISMSEFSTSCSPVDVTTSCGAYLDINRPSSGPEPYILNGVCVYNSQFTSISIESDPTLLPPTGAKRICSCISPICLYQPTSFPTSIPTLIPTCPTSYPTPKLTNPTSVPTVIPTSIPTSIPTNPKPTIEPTIAPSTKKPTKSPTLKPNTNMPSKSPTRVPTSPTKVPTLNSQIAIQFSTPTKYPTKNNVKNSDSESDNDSDIGSESDSD